MIAEWFVKKRVQAHCPHDWRMTNRYWGEFRGSLADIYCPMCDKYRRRIDLDKAESLLAKQRIAREYEEGGR